MTRCTQGLPKGNGLVVFNPGLYIIDRLDSAISCPIVKEFLRCFNSV